MGVGARAVAASVVVVLVVLCLFVAQRARTAARAQMEALAARDRSDQLVRIIQDALARTDSQPGKPLAAIITTLIDDLKKTPSPDVSTRLVIASAQQAAGLLLLRGGELDRATSYLQESYESRVRELGPLHADVARSLAAIGELHLAKRNWCGAREAFVDAVRIFRGVEASDAELGLALLHVATAKAGCIERDSQTGNQEAMTALDEGITLTGASTEPMIQLQLAQALEMRATLGARARNHEQAAKDYSDAAAKMAALLGPDDRSTMRIRRAGAGHAIDHNLTAVAKHNFIELCENKSVSDDERIGWCSRYADLFLQHREHEIAERVLVEALAMLAKRNQDPRTPLVRIQLLRCLLAQDDYQGAEAVLADCLESASTSPDAWALRTKELAAPAVELYTRWNKPERAMWWRDDGIRGRK